MEILKPESNTDVRLFPTAGKDGEEEETSDDYSFTVVHSESKARSDAVNLEPAVVIEPEPGEAEHDGDLDALDMNSEEHDSVDQDALPYPLAFLAVESKSEDGMWEPAANVKVESDAQNEDFGVRLEELGEVSKEAWKGIKSKTRPYVVEAERRETQKAQSRLNKKKCRASKPEEELKKIREKDRLRKRMALASQTAEDAARRREKDRLRKRRATEVRQQQMRSCLAQLGMCSSKSQHTGASELDLIKQSELWGSVALFADLARQREQSRLRKQKYLASQSPEEVQKRREKDRLRKRKMLSCQTVEEVELRRARDRQRKRRLKQLEEKLEQQLVQQTDLERSTAILLELQQFERRRERNRLSKRRALASQTAQQVERRRERDRLRKRRVRLRDTAQESDCSVKDQTNEAWEGYMRIRTRRSGQAAKYQDYKTDEELERTRERNRLYMRKFRASQSMDEVEKRREKGRMYKRLAVMKMSTEEAAQQREQNRMYMQRLRASQTPEEVEKRREKGRMYKKLSTLRQTPEEAERKREQNRLYMRKLRASQTPEEVERRKEKNRMYKRLSVLRRSSEEAERQREQNRLYMRQLRAAKKGLKLDAQNTGGNMRDRFYMKSFEEVTRENMRKTRQSVRQEIVQSCSAQDIEQHFRIAAEAGMQDGQHLEEAASHLMGKQHSLFIDRVEKQLGGMQTIEQVEREISRQLWQKTGFWDYLALLNKPQSDGKVLKTFEACDDDRASAKNY